MVTKTVERNYEKPGNAEMLQYCTMVINKAVDADKLRTIVALARDYKKTGVNSIQGKLALVTDKLFMGINHYIFSNKLLKDKGRETPNSQTLLLPTNNGVIYKIQTMIRGKENVRILTVYFLNTHNAVYIEQTSQKVTVELTNFQIIKGIDIMDARWRLPANA